ncbi:MAG: sigma-70 family RNA polymerase sigma factor [Deltaproteobacteria bacterium]|nr:sigma-70 family RNA polymerase sigma factor [Deltaproteobacteria bacterium]
MKMLRCRNAESFEIKGNKDIVLETAVKKTTQRFLPRWPLPYSNRLKLASTLDEEGNIKKAAREGFWKKEERDNGIAADSIRLYFKDIRQHPLLISAEEEKKLARKIAKGDKKARRRMIEANLRLVINIAKRHVQRGLPLHDLVEEGNIGLIQAVEHFKPTKGCKFSTYATFWIKQAIERAIINQVNVVRVPIHVTADISKLMKATRELTATLKRKPEIIELSEKTGLSGRYIKKLSTIMKKSCSLEAAIMDDGDQSLLDLIEDTTVQQPIELINQSIRYEKVQDWLKMLDDRERAVIRRRFGFDKKEEAQTLQSIGKSIGVSRERIRQIEAKTLNKLKEIAAHANITSLATI